MIRVAIVDDDVVYRTGRAALLAPIDGIKVNATLDFEEALAYGDSWNDIDVALVDAYDARSTLKRTEASRRAGVVMPGVDRFGGVRVVQAIRACRGTEAPTIIVVSHYKSGNALLWKRMAEAGADFFYDHFEVGDANHLVEAILRPARKRSVSAGEADLRSLGLGPRARVNVAIETLLAEEPVGAMLTAGVPHKALRGAQHRSRKLRAQLESLLDMRAHWHRDSERRLKSPPLSQLRPIVRRALGLDLRTEDDLPSEL
jgi:DNA-binding NarL/FixJ family response regulator